MSFKFYKLFLILSYFQLSLLQSSSINLDFDQYDELSGCKKNSFYDKDGTNLDLEKIPLQNINLIALKNVTLEKFKFFKKTMTSHCNTNDLRKISLFLIGGKNLSKIKTMLDAINETRENNNLAKFSIEFDDCTFPEKRKTVEERPRKNKKPRVSKKSLEQNRAIFKNDTSGANAKEKAIMKADYFSDDE